MRFKPCAMILCLCCCVAGSSIAAQQPPVNPNNPGGSQEKPNSTNHDSRTNRHESTMRFHRALTPDVKQQIADEIRNQLALENQEAQEADVPPTPDGIERMLSDGHKHIFVVSSTLDVVDSNKVECALSDGDVLELMSSPPDDATTADLLVLASKGGNECAKTSTVTVQLTDLQEMQNHIQEQIDQGLQELRNKKCTGGATSAASVVPAVPAYIELGQTRDQVQAALGPPIIVANIGSKVIYFYNVMKVIFMDGKVSDVQ
ncbi:MAG: hypothetical protein ABSC77_06855 [Terracidiphilus sp.]